MSIIKANDIVIYNDDINRTPYLVHTVNFIGNTLDSVSLGLEDYPDVEQDNYTPIEQITKLYGAELLQGRKIIRLSLT